MSKFNFILCTLAATLVFSCASKQVGLKENWIDERDLIALASNYVSVWMVNAGRPTLVEINRDTVIYYYNYRPTMYATTIYDSMTVFKTWGTAKETKPSLENATEVWGSRKNIIQIKVVNDIAVSAIVTDGPDKKTFIRELNGDFVLDPLSGFNSNISNEQKIGRDSQYFKSAYSRLNSKDANATSAPTGTNMSPWEYYHYKQQVDANAPVAVEQEIPVATGEMPAVAEQAVPAAAESVVETPAAAPTTPATVLVPVPTGLP